MMNYETFKETVEREFMDYMPVEYQSMDLHIKTCVKTNCKLDSISLFSKEGLFQ